MQPQQTEFSLSPDLIEHYRGLPTSLISDCLERLSGTVGLRPLNQRPNLAGRAFTVKTRPGDNLFVHLALDLALPGDVIVVDAGGDTTNAIVGEIMQRYAHSRGIVGFVIDGAVRDVSSFETGPFQCYARGVSHRGPYKNGPGTVGEAISVDGMLVNHGDLIIGDADGLISLCPDVAQPLLAKVLAAKAMEQQLMEQIDGGTFDRAWLAPLLDGHPLTPKTETK